MKKYPWGRLALAAACMLLLGLALWLLPQMTGSARIPGLTAKDRTLLRIWTINAPGGGQAWLKKQLRQFEKQHPGVSTYLRNVAAEELSNPESLPPDIVLYMPGDLTAPDDHFLPISGEMTDLLREELLRCGRWKGQQYGLPLCYGAWVLAIDGTLEPGSAVTPAPTTLLGKPAATASAGAMPEPGYPLEAAAQAACALQSPGGTALFTLGLLLEDLPPLPDSFGSLSASEVYSAFQGRKCATAMLTTGQATAFFAQVSGSSSFPFRLMAAQEIITDQVWLASVTPDAPPEAALLLSHLASAEGQKALSGQGLHTVRRDLTLYAAGISATVEQAARQSLSAINAYLPPEDTAHAAWQFFQGRTTLSEALLPLL